MRDNYRYLYFMLGFLETQAYKYKHTIKCMYKLLHILCMLKILIKAVSYDSHLAACEMSKYTWEKEASKQLWKSNQPMDPQPSNQGEVAGEKNQKVTTESGSLPTLPLQMRCDVLL